ncbi:MAG: DUF1800 domain-containing protein [Bacteroidetes bacterium]|nr:DUF1800 domain-containing protein [Bacteroidota bacterium]
MDRREFISMKPTAAASPTGIKVANRRTSTGLAKYSGSWTQAEAKHLLSRTLFGFKTSELASFTSKGLDTAVADILNVSSTAPNPPLNNYSSADPNVPLGSTWVNANQDPTYNPQRRTSFKTWWTSLLIQQDATILEKMVLFLHNHFATQTETIDDPRMIYNHNAMLRANALGNFKSLVKLVTKDAGMLIYLNGALNTKAAPDENYARELQELFCVGKGPDSKYTEDDVKAAARVLTGWRVTRGANPVIVSFDSTKHDATDKVFSSFYSNATVTGETGSTAGDLELDDLLNMIFSVDEVAKFICRKLYRFFVYYEIDADTETNVIIPLANHFRTNNYDLKPVLEKLLLSEHFYDMANRGCYIKTPMDHVVGFARQTEMAFPDTSKGVMVQYDHWALWYYYSAIIGLDIGDPPNVAGWQAYYQEPQYYEMWINSDSLPKRNQFTDYLLFAGYSKSGYTTKASVLDMADRTSDPQTADTLVADSLALLLPMDASSSLKASVKSALLPGGIPDYNWKDAWNTYKSNPGNTTNTKNVENLLILMYKSIMNLSEYQLI